MRQMGNRLLGVDETRAMRKGKPVSRCLVAPYSMGFNAGGISVPERGGTGLLSVGFAEQRLAAGDDGTGTTTHVSFDIKIHGGY